MKNIKIYMSAFLGATFMLMSHAMVAQDLTNTNSASELAAIRQLKNLPEKEIEPALSNLSADRMSIQNELINLLQNGSEKVKQSASYLLGQYRMDAAAPILAKIITLRKAPEPQDRESLIVGYPAMEALIKIGNPSIPAVIRNLAESDDAKVRDLSLKVLCRIDADKDIVQLRLQKALSAEKDSQKQARLQTALKSLAEKQFDK